MHIARVLLRCALRQGTVSSKCVHIFKFTKYCQIVITLMDVLVDIHTSILGESTALHMLAHLCIVRLFQCCQCVEYELVSEYYLNFYLLLLMRLSIFV